MNRIGKSALVGILGLGLAGTSALAATGMGAMLPPGVAETMSNPTAGDQVTVPNTAQQASNAAATNAGLTGLVVSTPTPPPAPSIPVSQPQTLIGGSGTSGGGYGGGAASSGASRAAVPINSGAGNVGAIPTHN